MHADEAVLQEPAMTVDIPKSVLFPELVHPSGQQRANATSDPVAKCFPSRERVILGLPAFAGLDLWL